MITSTYSALSAEEIGRHALLPNGVMYVTANPLSVHRLVMSYCLFGWICTHFWYLIAWWKEAVASSRPEHSSIGKACLVASHRSFHFCSFHSGALSFP